MSDASRYPAGWYPDPGNAAILRWWDGLRWTDATQPVYQPPPAYQPPQPASQPPQPAAEPAPAEPAPAEPHGAGPAAAEPAAIVPSEPTPAAEPAPAEPARAAAEPPAIVAPEPVAPAVAEREPVFASAAPAFAAPGSHAPAVPPQPPLPYAAYPGPADATEVAPRRDIPTGTVWIWLVVLLPLVSLLSFFLLDWRGFIDDIVTESMSPSAGTQTLAMNWTIGSLAISLLGYVVVAAQIVFAFLDWRVLRARGVERPFHWAWIFLALVATNGVYVIGRGVVLRRRTGTGLTPVWVWIAVTALSWIVGIVFAIVLMNEVFAVLSRDGVLAP